MAQAALSGSADLSAWLAKITAQLIGSELSCLQHYSHSLKGNITNFVGYILMCVMGNMHWYGVMENY
jgi:type IV secretory pathway VirB2 component (pilin)